MGAGLAPRGFEPSLVWRGAPARVDEPPLAGKSSRLRDEFGPLGFLDELFLGELFPGELFLGVLLEALSGRESLSAISNTSFSSCALLNFFTREKELKAFSLVLFFFLLCLFLTLLFFKQILLI
jgi:hypothetical protein